MFKDNQLILKRFNGDEVYSYTEGEYRYWVDEHDSVLEYNHNIVIYFDSVLSSLSDSVCEECGGVHIDITISSIKKEFARLNHKQKITSVPTLNRTNSTA